MTISPSTPVAGRNIGFTLEGLKPWQKVEVGFIDPAGAPVEWIAQLEYRYKPVNGQPVVKQTLFVPADGKVEWTRIGTSDLAGRWTVEIGLSDGTHRVDYSVVDSPLSTAQVDRVGLTLGQYQGSIGPFFIAANVPRALVLDLDAHLSQVASALEALGFGVANAPEVFLVASKAMLLSVGQAIDKPLTGIEAGIYTPDPPDDGIFMRTDNTISELRMTAAHEFVHVAFYETSPQFDLPAWLNEGCAKYYELSLGAAGDPAMVAKREAYQRADTAISAVDDSTFIPLRSLESQAEWVAVSDLKQAGLRYSEGYMACRYLIEKYGPGSVRKILTKVGQGQVLEAGLNDVIGSGGYNTFESAFQSWLRSWKEPERESAKALAATLSELEAEAGRISEEREKNLNAGNLTNQVRLISSAESAQTKASALKCTAVAGSLCTDARDLFAAVAKWLKLEIDYYNTLDRTKLDQANGMIPEVNARTSLFKRALGDFQIIYALD
ncbi:MAG: hypothetical protein HY682_11730 [Chloroflexi bacterium]|nr:hypothetical protein [Chloroflexota bacterium]